MSDLLEQAGVVMPWSEHLGPGTVLLRRRALDLAPTLLAEVAALAACAPFRQMSTPGGQMMSAAMTNCGAVGWVSDADGYRYSAIDPVQGLPWPAMPDRWREFARGAASTAGFRADDPDVCLINRYAPGARMGLHQDRDERDFAQPIVSVSLGLSAVFILGGLTRRGPTQRIRLEHGDVLVWGGPDRLRYHGVAPIADGQHPLAGPWRYNLTFRKAL